MVPSSFRVLLLTPMGSVGSGVGRSAEAVPAPDELELEEAVPVGLEPPEEALEAGGFFCPEEPEEEEPEDGEAAVRVSPAPDSPAASESSSSEPKISPTTSSAAPWPRAWPKALPPSVMPDSTASPMA